MIVSDTIAKHFKKIYATVTTNSFPKVSLNYFILKLFDSFIWEDF